MGGSALSVLSRRWDPGLLPSEHRPWGSAHSGLGPHQQLCWDLPCPSVSSCGWAAALGTSSCSGDWMAGPTYRAHRQAPQESQPTLTCSGLRMDLACSLPLRSSSTPGTRSPQTHLAAGPAGPAGPGVGSDRQVGRQAGGGSARPGPAHRGHFQSVHPQRPLQLCPPALQGGTHCSPTALPSLLGPLPTCIFRLLW